MQLGQIRFMSRYPGDHVIVPIHRNLQGLRTVLRMPDTSECVSVTELMISLAR